MFDFGIYPACISDIAETPDGKKKICQKDGKNYNQIW